MRKKTTLLLIVSVILISLISLFIFRSHNNESNTYISHEQRNKQIEEFSKVSNLPEEDNLCPSTENSGGFTGINIENENELLKYINLDMYFSVENNIRNSVNILNQLYLDTANLNAKEIKDYYTKYKEKITVSLGIIDEDVFQSAVNKLKAAKSKNNKKGIFSKAKVLNIDKVGNIITLKLQLTTIDNNIIEFDTNILISNGSDNKYKTYIFFK